MTVADTALTPDAWEALSAAVADLRRAVPEALLDDPTGLFVGSAAATVRPRSTAEVQAVVRAARAYGLSLVPRGGGTSLAGGAVAHEQEIVLDLSGLREPLQVDPVEQTVTAGAGLTLAEVQSELALHGLWLPLDIGSWHFATVGGVVATNAGGSQVLRHGHVRRMLLGVEAVLGSGEVIRRLDGRRKDNNGPDISGLLCGSEGTLGVITAATFAVVPLRQRGCTLAISLPSWTAVLEAALAARDIKSVQAIEMVSSTARSLVDALGTVRPPFAAHDGHLLLVDLDGAHALTDAESLLSSLACTDVVVAETPADRASLWATRHAVTDGIRRQGRPHKLDLVLPLTAIADFLATVEALVPATRPDAQAILFGHIADGNVHVNILGAEPDDERLLDDVVALALSGGGHASAEHGIGVAKARWLPLIREPVELELLEDLRALFDPDNVLNPRVFRIPSAPAGPR